MHKRIKSITVATGAFAALALGGSALASASSSTTATSAATSPAPAVAPEKVSATDPGPAVQQGDQTTPDSAVAAKTHAKNAQADPPGANDTTSPDQGNQAPENAPENASENASESAPSDGPGGFADSSPTADTQQQGEH